jgi:uncharacterized protein YdiU (UPF0061 family)
MKVMVIKSTNPLTIARMWYEEHIGEEFEVENDSKYDDMYKTVNPIYKEHRGNIYKSDCEIVKEGEPNG